MAIITDFKNEDEGSENASEMNQNEDGASASGVQSIGVGNTALKGILISVQELNLKEEGGYGGEMKQNESAVTYLGGMLADDTVMDIFIRCPDKTIARCQVLSRAWRDRIQNPWDLSRHAQLCRTMVALIKADYILGETPKFFVFDNKETLEELSLRCSEFGDLQTYNTCNGYLLLGKDSDGGPLLLIHVFNQFVIELPIGTSGRSMDLVLACNNKNDYYVLQLFEGRKGLSFKILNIKQETWVEGLGLSVERVDTPAVVLRGSAFYLGKRGSKSYLVQINIISASRSLIQLNDLQLEGDGQLCLLEDGIGMAAAKGDNIVLYRLEGEALVQICELQFGMWRVNNYGTNLVIEKDDLVMVHVDGDSVVRIKLLNNEVKVLRIPTADYLHCNLVQRCKLLASGYSK